MVNPYFFLIADILLYFQGTLAGMDYQGLVVLKESRVSPSLDFQGTRVNLGPQENRGYVGYKVHLAMTGYQGSQAHQGSKVNRVRMDFQDAMDLMESQDFQAQKVTQGFLVSQVCTVVRATIIISLSQNPDF